MKNKKGFTLIELVIVMAIIAIIAVLIAAALLVSQRNARNTKLINDAKILKTALGSYYVQMRDFPLAPYTTAYADYSVRDRNAYILAAASDPYNQNALGSFISNSSPVINTSNGGAVCYNKISNTSFRLWVVDESQAATIRAGGTACAAAAYASGNVCPCGFGYGTQTFSEE